MPWIWAAAVVTLHFYSKKIGCTLVLGVDFNQDAINCANGNRRRNPGLAPVEFIHSDLFVEVMQAE